MWNFPSDCREKTRQTHFSRFVDTQNNNKYRNPRGVETCFIGGKEKKKYIQKTRINRILTRVLFEPFRIRFILLFQYFSFQEKSPSLSLCNLYLVKIVLSTSRDKYETCLYFFLSYVRHFGLNLFNKEGYCHTICYCVSQCLVQSKMVNAANHCLVQSTVRWPILLTIVLSSLQ